MSSPDPTIDLVDIMKDVMVNQSGVYRAAYIEGLKEGIRRYAWWKNGCQYVGSCGTTLKQALEEIK